jgi:hypothetical protein
MWNRNKRRSLLGAVVMVWAAIAACSVNAQVCPFENGGSTLENDGLVLTRYALGLRGAPMVANTSFAALDIPTIESNIACPSCGLRVTDDKDALNSPIFTVADATIISRRLAGFEGTALTNGLALGSGSRNTPAAVQSFLLSGCGATGGTVTSVTAGTGLTGGTITTAGTIAADTAYLQRRIATACSPGSFVTAVAADGTPTCAAPPASGGSGTVTSVGTGLGIVATGPNIVNGAIVSNGLMELAYGFILPQGCTAGQVPKSDGSGVWTCSADNAGSGTVSSITLGDGLTNNISLPFTSGGTITTSGSVTLPVPYRLPQTCNIGQVPIKTFGTWGCVDGPRKFIHIGVAGVALFAGATYDTGFGTNAGITLPKIPPGGTPTVYFGFVLPPDYTQGAAIEATLIWHSNSPNCIVQLKPGGFSGARAGSDSIINPSGGSVSQGITVVGGELLTTSATANRSKSTTIAISSPDAGNPLQPGDAINVGFFREARAGGSDTCTGYMRIQGISISYL